MLISIAAGMAAMLLLSLYLAERHRTDKARGSFLDDCRHLFGRIERRVQYDGFPEIRGEYRSYRASLRPTMDTLTMRKLPSLWLEVSVISPIPYKATLSYLARPCNTEAFSPSHRLPERLPLPRDWPQEPAMLRSDRDDSLPPLGIIGDHLRLWRELRLKEVVVTPRGVRLVVLAEEGDRASYMLMRQAHFSGEPIDASFVKRVLDAAILLAQDLQASGAKVPKQDRGLADFAARKGDDGFEGTPIQA